MWLTQIYTERLHLHINIRITRSIEYSLLCSAESRKAESGEAALWLTAVVREERGSPLSERGELLPYRTEGPMEDWVERGGQGWS